MTSDLQEVSRRRARIDPARWSYRQDQLIAQRGHIDLAAVSAAKDRLSASARALTVSADEHLPQTGPVMFVANHVATPVKVERCYLSEDGVLLVDALSRHLGRPVWLFYDLHVFSNPGLYARCQRVLERMGGFPGTVDNAQRLFAMGECVLIFPEGRDSHPGYALRPFHSGFARIAAESGVPVVPLVLLGPHESWLRIEDTGRAQFLNMGDPIEAEYRLEIMPATRIAAGDEPALRTAVDALRASMNQVIDAALAGRPLARLAHQLQRKYGDEGGVPAEALVPVSGILAELDSVQSLGHQRQRIEKAVAKARDYAWRRAFIQEFYAFSAHRSVGIWDEGLSTAQAACERLVDLLTDAIPPGPGRVLDVLSGTNVATGALAQRLGSTRLLAMGLTAIDPATWEALAPGVPHQVMDPGQMTFPHGSFETIICLDGPFRFGTRADFLREAWYALCPQGRLLMVDRINHGWIERHLPAGLASVAASNRLADPQTYKRLLERSGFVDVEVIDLTSRAVNGYLQAVNRYVTDKRTRLAADAAACATLDQVHRRETQMLRSIKHYVLVRAKRGAVPAGTEGGTAGRVGALEYDQSLVT